MTTFNDLCLIVKDIIQNENQMVTEEKSDKEILAYVNKRMISDLFPILVNICTNEGNKVSEYIKLRNKENELVSSMAKKEMMYLSGLDFCCKTSIHIMSSFNSGTNLIADSDIDFGLLVLNLTDKKCATIGKILEEKGYKFAKVFNPDNPKNTYTSYEKIVDGIEIEVKIRDHDFSQVMLMLHNYLDNTLTEHQRTMITYGKYLFKTHEKRLYNLFKKLIYEYAFNYIEGGHLMAV
jgi:hypothetical protein